MSMKLVKKDFEKDFNIYNYYKSKSNNIYFDGFTNCMFGHFLLDYINEDFSQIIFKGIVSLENEVEDLANSLVYKSNDPKFLNNKLNSFLEKIIDPFEITFKYLNTNENLELANLKPYLFMLFTQLYNIKKSYYYKLKTLTTIDDKYKSNERTFKKILKCFNLYETFKRIYSDAINICFNDDNMELKNKITKERIKDYLENLYTNLLSFDNLYTVSTCRINSDDIKPDTNNSYKDLVQHLSKKILIQMPIIVLLLYKEINHLYISILLIKNILITIMLL